MRWVIEYANGKVIKENESSLDFTFFKTVYFEWNSNRCGFRDNGIFFINNTIYDFKIDVINKKLVPIVNKTGGLVFGFNGCDNKIISWNIGYKLGEETYLFRIYPNGNIDFCAEKDKNKKIIRMC